MVVLLLVAFSPVLAIATIAGVAVTRERARRALRECPGCASRAIVRALPRPPYHVARFMHAALAFRCTACGRQLFELRRAPPRGLVLGEQLVALLGTSTLPPARLLPKSPPRDD